MGSRDSEIDELFYGQDISEASKDIATDDREEDLQEGPADSSQPVETVLANGKREYHLGGKLHRVDGPASIWVDSSGRSRYEWHLYGELHREDGPAISSDDGTERWYKRGKLHRVGGPAVISGGKETAWIENGEYHRTDGPAIIGKDPGRHIAKGKKKAKSKGRSEWGETYKTYAVRGDLFPDTWRGRRAWRRASQKDSRRSSREV